MIRSLKILAIPALIADIIYVIACVVTVQYLFYDLPDSRRLPAATNPRQTALALGTWWR
jgi:hypothetical protein